MAFQARCERATGVRNLPFRRVRAGSLCKAEWDSGLYVYYAGLITGEEFKSVEEQEAWPEG